MAVLQSPPKSLIVVFTDNGSKNLKLKNDIMRMKKEKNIEIFIGKANFWFKISPPDDNVLKVTLIYVFSAQVAPSEKSVKWVRNMKK